MFFNWYGKNHLEMSFSIDTLVIIKTSKRLNKKHPESAILHHSLFEERETV